MPVRTQAASTGGSRTESLGPIAKAMQKSMNEALKIPHFGYNEEYDVTNLVELRKVLKPLAAEYGIKLSYMPFIIKVSFLFVAFLLMHLIQGCVSRFIRKSDSELVAVT